ncbi:ninjurin-1-like [Arapaima gigas]
MEMNSEAERRSGGETPRPGRWERSPRPLNMNHYANKKSAAESLLDVALLMANASQLKAVLDQGPDFTFYAALITLISISLILQVAVGVLLIFIVKWDLNDQTQHYRLNMLENAATAMVFVILVPPLSIPCRSRPGGNHRRAATRRPKWNTTGRWAHKGTIELLRGHASKSQHALVTPSDFIKRYQCLLPAFPYGFISHRKSEIHTRAARLREVRPLCFTRDTRYDCRLMCEELATQHWGPWKAKPWKEDKSQQL